MSYKFLRLNPFLIRATFKPIKELARILPDMS